MRTPESWLKQIEKLRAKHTANFKANKFVENDALNRKIITAWEGYHLAISKQLDRAGCAVGNEHVDYSQPLRIQHLVQSRDYFAKQSELHRA